MVFHYVAFDHKSNECESVRFIFLVDCWVAGDKLKNPVTRSYISSPNDTLNMDIHYREICKSSSVDIIYKHSSWKKKKHKSTNDVLFNHLNQLYPSFK